MLAPWKAKVFRSGEADEGADRLRAVRGVALGRANWIFAGSDACYRAAAIYSLVETCTLNDVDPQAWLACVLARLPDHPAKRIDELLPWI
jgi:transposase